MSNIAHRQLGATKIESIYKQDINGLPACTTLSKSIVKPKGSTIANFNQIIHPYAIRSNKAITQAETKGYPFKIQNL